MSIILVDWHETKERFKELETIDHKLTNLTSPLFRTEAPAKVRDFFFAATCIPTTAASIHLDSIPYLALREEFSPSSFARVFVLLRDFSLSRLRKNLDSSGVSHGAILAIRKH